MCPKEKDKEGKMTEQALLKETSSKFYYSAALFYDSLHKLLQNKSLVDDLNARGFSESELDNLTELMNKLFAASHKEPESK